MPNLSNLEVVTFAAGAFAGLVTAVVVGPWAYTKLKIWMKFRGVYSVLEELREKCNTRVDDAAWIILQEMAVGLRYEDQMIKMRHTYVYAPPTQGFATGNFYGVHFGGTFCKMVRIQLDANNTNGIAVLHHEKQLIPDTVRRADSYDKVFDFIATELKKFVEDEGEGSSASNVQIRELGFSFSFPMKHNTISSGNLIRWTKGFTVLGGFNDVAALLQRSMDKIGLQMRVAALVNDAVGSFCFGHYMDRDTAASVVIGTGTNSCYLERISSIRKPPPLVSTSDVMIISTEWGDLCDSRLPGTDYDDIRRSRKTLEKMICGMHLGDTVRTVLRRMIEEYGAEIIPASLGTPFTLTFRSVVDMHHDESHNLDEVARVLSEVYEITVSVEFRRIVVDVCDIVCRRAANLVAAGISGILQKREWNVSAEGGRRAVVVMEGSVYKGYSKFREYLHEAVGKLSPHIVLSEFDHGPEIGAALVAASQSNQALE